MVRVGDDVYVATSTFEWFPGVRIHHTRDFETWTPIGHVLDSVELLDLKGVPDSCGVWAPCLSHDGERFHLVFSVVKAFDGPFKDTPNYVTSAERITGPWSTPTFISATGFDGSLFHDEDGRSWYLTLQVDPRRGKFFGGIVIQEWDRKERRLKGEHHLLTKGTELGITEGPHLYRRDGWVYLVTAEGGTEYGHAVSVMRSRHVLGPYETHPGNPIMTSRAVPAHPLQKAGHASWVDLDDGSSVAAFLVGRPDHPGGKCFLGRETAIERLVWRDGWPHTEHGQSVPRQAIPRPMIDGAETAHADLPNSLFADPDLGPEWQSLRIPIDGRWCTVGGGEVTLRGRESLGSTHEQSLIARRVQHHKARVQVTLDVAPSHFQHAAGLVFFYNTGHYHYAYVTWDPDRQSRVASVITCDNHVLEDHVSFIELPPTGPTRLKAELEYPRLRFRVEIEGECQAVDLGPSLDASILSDDHVREGGQHYRAAFTGPFVGLCCQDLNQYALMATFSDFLYIPGR